jgi:hypothetical protein
MPVLSAQPKSITPGKLWQGVMLLVFAYVGLYMVRIATYGPCSHFCLSVGLYFGLNLAANFTQNRAVISAV